MIAKNESWFIIMAELQQEQLCVRLKIYSSAALELH